MNANNPNTPEPTPNEQNTRPEAPEINPAKPGNETEVDLDKNKTETYPNNTPPERH